MSLAAGGVVWILVACGWGIIGWSVLVGHLVAQGVTLSWILAALVTFDRQPWVFMSMTVGLWPLRLGLVVAALAVCAAVVELHPPGLFISFVVSLALGQVVEVWTFTALGDASREIERARRRAAEDAARAEGDGEGEG